VIDDKSYRVEQTDNGFRMTQRDDRTNTVDFRRVGDFNENWQTDPNTGRVCRESSSDGWLVCTFEGVNRKYRQMITVRLNRQGELIDTNLNDRQQTASSTATYSRNTLIIDDKSYRIEKTNTGFRMIEREDPDNTVDFRRIGDFNENWQTDPNTG